MGLHHYAVLLCPCRRLHWSLVNVLTPHTMVLWSTLQQQTARSMRSP